MLYILINRTRPDLSEAEYAELGRLAQQFYDAIPEGVVLHGDWAANDHSRSFALLEAQDESLLKEIQAPFHRYVDMELIPVTTVKGWLKR